MGRVSPWTTGRGGLDEPQAGGVLDRRGVLVLGCSSQLLLRRLDVSDVGPVERVAVRWVSDDRAGHGYVDLYASLTSPSSAQGTSAAYVHVSAEVVRARRGPTPLRR